MFTDLQTRKGRLQKFDWVDVLSQTAKFVRFWVKTALYTSVAVLLFLGLAHFFAITGLSI